MYHIFLFFDILSLTEKLNTLFWWKRVVYLEDERAVKKFLSSAFKFQCLYWRNPEYASGSLRLTFKDESIDIIRYRRLRDFLLSRGSLWMKEDLS